MSESAVTAFAVPCRLFTSYPSTVLKLDMVILKSLKVNASIWLAVNAFSTKMTCRLHVLWNIFVRFL